MKVAHVVTWLNLGGAEQVATDLCLGMRRRGLEPWFVPLLAEPAIAADIAGGMRRRLRDGGVRLAEMRGVGGTKLGMLSAMPRLLAFLARGSFDLVHAHVDHADLATSVAGRILKLNLARTIHNVTLWPGRPGMGRFAERGFRDDLVVGVSREALHAHETLRAEFGLELSRHAEVITNGVPEVASVPRPPGAAGRIRLAYFGRSTHQKGLDVLLEAVARVVRADADFELVLHTDLAFDAAGRAAVERLGPKVTLSPPVGNARELMGSFDAVVVPSRFEGIGLVALEAFRAGTPVIATRAPGLREATPSGWPLTVDVEDVSALADLLVAVVTRRVDLRALRGPARRHGERFGVEAMVDRYVGAYDRYLGRSDGPVIPS